MTHTVVGLDIGGSGVRAAEFVVGRRTTLRRFASVPLAPGVIRAGLVADQDALAAALVELWAQGKFSTKTVVLGIANDSVLVRQMDLEWMPPADFRKGLRYQVADALPVPVDEANLDYYMLEEIDRAATPATPDAAATAATGAVTTAAIDDQRKVARVMLVAAGRDMVDAFVRSVQAAGLRPVRVDLLPFALVRAVSAVSDPAGADGQLEAIVDIGADTVVAVVHQGGRPRFVRTLNGHGGSTITSDLMERYEWTWEDAERTKIVLGLPGFERLEAYGDLGTLDESMLSLSDHPAHAAIAEHVDALAAELRATLDYFRDSSGDQQELSRVLLTGRASALGGLVEVLEERLQVPVQHLSVLDRIRTPRRLPLPEDDWATLAVPAGLCLGAAS